MIKRDKFKAIPVPCVCSVCFRFAVKADGNAICQSENGKRERSIISGKSEESVLGIVSVRGHRFPRQLYTCFWTARLVTDRLVTAIWGP